MGCKRPRRLRAAGTIGGCTRVPLVLVYQKARDGIISPAGLHDFQVNAMI